MLELPERIKRIIASEQYDIDNIGMSGSSVLLFEDKVLKIQNISDESENEYMMMKWLNGKLPVPDAIAYENYNGKNYLLMSRIKGTMSCADDYMNNPDLLVELLAKAMHMLWEVDVTDCPSRINLDKKLEMAKYNVENNLVDVDNVQPDTFGSKSGFGSGSNATS